MNPALLQAISQRVGNRGTGGPPRDNPMSGGLPFPGGLQLPVSMPNLGIGNPSADPRGIQGILSRGAPVYRGGLPQARMGGGPNIGRPMMPAGGQGGPPMQAVARRLGR